MSKLETEKNIKFKTHHINLRKQNLSRIDELDITRKLTRLHNLTEERANPLPAVNGISKIHNELLNNTLTSTDEPRRWATNTAQAHEA